MDKNNFTRVIKSSMVALLSIITVISIDSIIYPRTFSSVLNSPINILRNIPLIALSYFFFKEVYKLVDIKSSNQEFIWERNGIGFVQDRLLWMAILETRSLNKIQKTELEQLSHLKSFSLELDVKNLCVRVFFYAKSLEELRDIIQKSKPILDIVIPDLKMFPVVDSSKLFGKKSYERIGNNFFLKIKNQLLILNFGSTKSTSFSFTDKMVFCFFPTSKNKKGINKIQSQWYSFDNLSQNSIFNGLNRVLINPQEYNFLSLRKKNTLDRIKIRYQIREQEKHSFQEGIAQFEKGLSFLLSQIKPGFNLQEMQNLMVNNNVINVLKTNNPVYNKIQNISPTSASQHENINHLYEDFPYITAKMNQICFELCNIQGNGDLSRGEKAKKCARRAEFCQKLLKNENFSSIIENVMKQKHEDERIHLTTELRQHLSYQQLICILAHLTQSSQFETVNEEIIGMIHTLFKLNINTQENSNLNPNSLFSLISKAKNREKNSPSLTSN